MAIELFRVETSKLETILNWSKIDKIGGMSSMLLRSRIESSANTTEFEEIV